MHVRGRARVFVHVCVHTFNSVPQTRIHARVDIHTRARTAEEAVKARAAKTSPHPLSSASRQSISFNPLNLSANARLPFWLAESSASLPSPPPPLPPLNEPRRVVGAPLPRRCIPPPRCTRRDADGRLATGRERASGKGLAGAIPKASRVVRASNISKPSVHRGQLEHRRFLM